MFLKCLIKLSFESVNLGIRTPSPLMSRNARHDKNGRFGERAPQLTMLAKLAILAIFCQFRQVISSTGIDTP